MRINTITIGGFTITANSADLGTGGNNLLEMQGLESPVRRVPFQQKPGNHGIFIEDSLYGERILVIKFQIIGSSVSDYKSRYEQFTEAIDITDRTTKTMTIVDSNSVSYEVSGIPTLYTGKHGNGQTLFDEFTFTFLCENWYFSSSTLNSEIIYLSDSVGLAIPLVIVPISFGAGTGGQATITNSGNVDSYPIITFYGELVEPLIRNNTTGEEFRYLATINSGDYIIVDMEAKTVTDQDGANQLGNVGTTQRDFFALQPGDNVLQFSHNDVYSIDPSAVVEWRDSYLAI